MRETEMERETGQERQRATICWLIPQMLTIAKAAPIQSSELATTSSLLFGWQEPNYAGHPLLPPRWAWAESWNPELELGV